MGQFNVSNFLSRFINNSAQNFNRGAQAQGNENLQHLETAQNLQNLTQHILQDSTASLKQFNPANRAALMRDLKMNNLESFQQSLYLKD